MEAFLSMHLRAVAQLLRIEKGWLNCNGVFFRIGIQAPKAHKHILRPWEAAYLAFVLCNNMGSLEPHCAPHSVRAAFERLIIVADDGLTALLKRLAQSSGRCTRRLPP